MTIGNIVLWGFAIIGAWWTGGFIVACIASRWFRFEHLGHFHNPRVRRIQPLPWGKR